MAALGNIGANAVALLHVLFFIYEFFLKGVIPLMEKRGTVEKGKGQGPLGLTEILFTNQALYNLALAAFLAWAVRSDSYEPQAIILSAIVILGVFGAFSASMLILFVQALPAALALVAGEIGRKGTGDLGFLTFTMLFSVFSWAMATFVKKEARNMRKAD